ncbi:MAG: hypothetical protein DLM70_17100 [Chloroflexi bacterium]|nr:MAG: hypothetical protein DLM70_17100 [Chloroflexota bacterium]
MGFAPSGTGMTLEGVEIDALEHGIGGLLEASHQGLQVARVVFDDERGRRLRAEIEPFGTRLVARFGFWQRVRDTWRPADDGLILSAEGLGQLRDVLQKFRYWVVDPDLQSQLAEDIAAERELLRRWPTAGADWLTVDSNSVAFHPRGIRITCSLKPVHGAPHAVLCQWRREESLWLPESSSMTLDTADVDSLLRALARLTDHCADDEPLTFESLPCTRGSTLSVTISYDPSTLLVRQVCVQTDAALGALETDLRMPLDYLPRFGRALAQVWSLLAATLTETERADLEQRDFGRYESLSPQPQFPGSEHSSQVSNAQPDVDLPVEMEEGPQAERAETPLDVEQEDVGTGAVGRRTGQAAADSQGQDETGSVEVPLYVRLRSVPLGRDSVSFSLQGSNDRPELVLEWEVGQLRLSLDHLGELLDGLRALYYDALRGRRGRRLHVGSVLPLDVGIDNQGPNLYCQLRQEHGDQRDMLAFPANEVPHFLDAAEAALAFR